MAAVPFEQEYLTDFPLNDLLDMAQSMTIALSMQLTSQIRAKELGLAYVDPFPFAEVMRFHAEQSDPRSYVTLNFPLKPWAVPLWQLPRGGKQIATLSFESAIQSLGSEVLIPFEPKSKKSKARKDSVAVTTLPRPHVIYERIAQIRRRNLETFQSGETLSNTLVEMLRPAVESRILKGIDPPLNSMISDAYKIFISAMVVSNALMIYIAVHHSLRAAADPGFIYGLGKEIAILEKGMPSTTWGASARKFVEKALALASSTKPTMAPLALGGTGKEGAPRNPNADESPSWIPYDDWTRLLFYMKIKGYMELRGADQDPAEDIPESSQAPYEYIAVALRRSEKQAGVIVLSTVEVGHAALIMTGRSMIELIALAQQKRRVIEANALFKQRFVHGGDWVPRFQGLLDVLLETLI